MTISRITLTRSKSMCSPISNFLFSLLEKTFVVHVMFMFMSCCFWSRFSTIFRFMTSRLWRRVVRASQPPLQSYTLMRSVCCRQSYEDPDCLFEVSQNFRVQILSNSSLDIDKRCHKHCHMLIFAENLNKTQKTLLLCNSVLFHIFDDTINPLIQQYWYCIFIASKSYAN